MLVSRGEGAHIAKIIDFGNAKATSQQWTSGAAVTGFRQMLGTPL